MSLTSTLVEVEPQGKIVNEPYNREAAQEGRPEGFIVIDRYTGRFVEEKIPCKVRCQLGFLFQTFCGRCILRCSCMSDYLKSSSIQLGTKYDHPASIADIPDEVVNRRCILRYRACDGQGENQFEKYVSCFHLLTLTLDFDFIESYGIDTTECTKKVDEFTSLNDFFYRTLLPEARPIAALNDDAVAVQPADCRLHVFNSIHEATTIWIKGSDFSLAKLIGPKFASEFAGGSLLISRLAPTDYHRYHSPVTGIVGAGEDRGTEYFSVKPLAITGPIDILGDNKRVNVPIESEQFVKPGQAVHKGDEIGFFAYGGSTIVTLFKAGAIEYDKDLVANSLAGMETLVRMGQSLGTVIRGKQHHHRHHHHQQQQQHPENETHNSTN